MGWLVWHIESKSVWLLEVVPGFRNRLRKNSVELFGHWAFWQSHDRNMWWTRNNLGVSSPGAARYCLNKVAIDKFENSNPPTFLFYQLTKCGWKTLLSQLRGRICTAARLQRELFDWFWVWRPFAVRTSRTNLGRLLASHQEKRQVRSMPKSCVV